MSKETSQRVGPKAERLGDERRPDDVPPEVVAEWWTPFEDFLAKERRYSAYTVRNYRQAFEDFYRWLVGAGLWKRGLGTLGSREMRDFVIEGQRRFDRRTLHNHASGLRTFFKFWMRREKLRNNPLLGVPLPKLEKRLPKFLSEEQMKLLLTGPQRLLENAGIDAHEFKQGSRACDCCHRARRRQDG